MAFLTLQVDASEIIDAMAEDPNFAREMWANLADGLDAGALRDDLHDMADRLPATIKIFADVFGALADKEPNT